MVGWQADLRCAKCSPDKSLRRCHEIIPVLLDFPKVNGLELKGSAMFNIGDVPYSAAKERGNAFSRSGVEAFPSINQFMTLDSHATFAPDDFAALEGFRGKAMAAGTLGALNLVIQGARDLPGRFGHGCTENPGARDHR